MSERQLNQTSLENLDESAALEEYLLDKRCRDLLQSGRYEEDLSLLKLPTVHHYLWLRRIIKDAPFEGIDEIIKQRSSIHKRY